MTATPDFTKALAVAASLQVDGQGRTHLPAHLRDRLRGLTPSAQRDRQRTKLPPLSSGDRARILDLRRQQHTYLEIQKRTGIPYARIAVVCQAGR